MTEIKISIPISDDMVPRFIDKNLMVTPLSEAEAIQFAEALEQAHGRLRYLDRLKEPISQAEWDEYRKFIADGASQMDFIRTILGRSARVGQKPAEERLQ